MGGLFDELVKSKGGVDHSQVIVWLVFGESYNCRILVSPSEFESFCRPLITVPSIFATVDVFALSTVSVSDRGTMLHDSCSFTCSARVVRKHRGSSVITCPVEGYVRIIVSPSSGVAKVRSLKIVRFVEG